MALADQAVDHHRRPDMMIYLMDRVRLTISNRHRAGLTAAEARLLDKVEAVIEEPGRRGSAGGRPHAAGSPGRRHD